MPLKLSSAVLLPALCLGVMATTGCRQSSRSSSVSSEDAPAEAINWGAQADPKPAFMLVCNDTGERGISDSDPRVVRYQMAVDSIEARFGISETMIGDQTWTAVDTLRKEGIKTSAIELMDGVNGLKESDQLGISYAEILANVMAVMVTNAGK